MKPRHYFFGLSRHKLFIGKLPLFTANPYVFWDCVPKPLSGYTTDGIRAETRKYVFNKGSLFTIKQVFCRLSPKIIFVSCVENKRGATH